jgi:N-acetylmuramic acid 6-phosphate etherase
MSSTSASSSSAPPPDRSHIDTEKRNPRTQGLHTLDVAGLVELMQREDRQVLLALKRASSRITALISAAEPGFLAGGRLIYVGAGTSGRLGVLDASEAPPTFCVPPTRVVGIIAGGDRALRTSSEGAEDDPKGAWEELEKLKLTGHDTLIAIAAGGTTPYALGALTFAKTKIKKAVDRPLTALLCCTALSEKPEHCDLLVSIKTGPEVLTGSTRLKAGTATKMALNTISTTLMVRSGKVHDNLMVDVRATNDKLRDRAARIITLVAGVDREKALELLREAEGETKVAIVMARKGATLERAKQLLLDSEGKLGLVIDKPAR